VLIAHSESLMFTEARSAPDRVRDFLRVSTGAIDALADELRHSNVRSVVTVARGSSDHAASHFAYLLLTRMGVLVTSLPPSAMTLYDAPIDPRGVAAISFSQSGQSPDLVAAMARLRQRGVLTAAFVNDVKSPLAEGAHYFIDLAAGPEQSVAATKSFVAQLAAGMQLVASWSRDQSLKVALAGVPDLLERATAEDWSAAIAPLVHADRAARAPAADSPHRSTPRGHA
jgi:glutamine---fructose-6-phosphate transaminase (isomerizing)